VKIKYTFVTGEIVEIEIDDQLGAEISEIEHKSDLKDRAETRRHHSIEQLGEQGVHFADPKSNIAAVIELKETMAELRADLEKLRKAILALQPQQQDLIQKIFFEERSIASIAAEDGVNEAAIRNRMYKICKRLKNYFEKS
jgi:RNA polymerase sigma-70 factor (ECF subfamily)